MKKLHKTIILIVSVLFILVSGFVVKNWERLNLQARGYVGTCGMLPDGPSCRYCKCETGKGLQGFPDYYCDDRSKPICVTSLDQIPKAHPPQETTIEEHQKGESK